MPVVVSSVARAGVLWKLVGRAAGPAFLAGGALAGGHGTEPAAPATPAASAPASHAPASAARAPEAKEAGAAPSSERAAAPTVSLDTIRDRLAQKLGAAPAPDAGSNVLRVATKPAALPAGEFVVGTGPRRGTRAAGRPRHAAETLLTAAPGAGAHWDYAGSGGPDGWSRMNPDFGACSTGTRQSPIDIRGGLKVDLDPVRFDYRPSGFRVVDNGHTVQVNLAAGNSIEVGGRRYELLQFHFHRPSEERIDGKQFEMVVHLVHRSLEGKLAVVAVLLERGPAQPIVQTVWNNLPLEKGEEVSARLPLDPTDLLPAERRYFTYMGSLTTPPCSEGVLWMVMKQAVPVSLEQEAIFAHLYPMNARPLQPTSGRTIKESN